MKFGTKLTVPTLQTSGVSKPEQRHGNLQDILNAMSQNQSSRIRKQLDKLSNKSTGSTAPPIDQMDPTINREDSTHTCMLPLDIIFKDSYDMSFFSEKPFQVDGNGVSKPEHVRAPEDEDILDLHTGESCPKDLDTSPSLPFPTIFPLTLTCKSTTEFEVSGLSSCPAAASPQSSTSADSPNAAMDGGTDTSADTEFAHAKSKSDACFERGFMTPPPETYVEEVRNLVAEQFKGKASRNIFDFVAVSRFFKESFHRHRNRSTTHSQSKITRAVRPSSSSSSAPLVPKSSSLNINAVFPEYASFSPYPSWLAPGSGAFSS